MAEKRIVKLKSSDEEIFEVDQEVASESLFVKHMIKDVGTKRPLPLLNVSSKILPKVIKYCTYHLQNQKTSEDKSAARIEDAIRTVWYAEFVDVDQQTLYDLILAANYMDIKSLLDLTIQRVADMIKEKTVEEVRKILKSRTTSPSRKKSRSEKRTTELSSKPLSVGSAGLAAQVDRPISGNLRNSVRKNENMDGCECILGS